MVDQRYYLDVPVEDLLHPVEHRIGMDFVVLVVVVIVLSKRLRLQCPHRKIPMVSLC